jgi:uncharacterized repeat protein (TIGR01451 family)
VCPALTLTKTADAPTVAAGGTIGFTLTATNGSGAGASATGLALTDPLPSGPGINWSIASGLFVCTIAGVPQTLTCNGSFLPPGFSISVHVTSPTTTASCSVYSNSATLTATNAPTVNADATTTVLCPVLGTLDVDASNTATKYDPLTDGLLVVRYLFGMTDAALTAGVLGATAARTSPTAIKDYLDGIRPDLDVDGNGLWEPSRDGLLILRYLFGLRGSRLIEGAFDPAGSRHTPETIAAHLQAMMP